MVVLELGVGQDAPALLPAIGLPTLLEPALLHDGHLARRGGLVFHGLQERLLLAKLALVRLRQRLEPHESALLRLLLDAHGGHEARADASQLLGSHHRRRVRVSTLQKAGLVRRRPVHGLPLEVIRTHELERIRVHVVVQIVEDLPFVLGLDVGHEMLHNRKLARRGRNVKRRLGRWLQRLREHKVGIRVLSIRIEDHVTCSLVSRARGGVEKGTHRLCSLAHESKMRELREDDLHLASLAPLSGVKELLQGPAEDQVAKEGEACDLDAVDGLLRTAEKLHCQEHAHRRLHEDGRSLRGQIRSPRHPSPLRCLQEGERLHHGEELRPDDELAIAGRDERRAALLRLELPVGAHHAHGGLNAGGHLFLPRAAQTIQGDRGREVLPGDESANGRLQRNDVADRLGVLGLRLATAQALADDDLGSAVLRSLLRCAATVEKAADDALHLQGSLVLAGLA
mmetsp:Transcript_604/g.2213  ORF Transcript_604/g.2213 Transcript_604/m.2213 type:complete len:455 (+) Transcript_604:1324-2688(+)